MTATDTYLLLRAFCDELVRCGLTDACTSPGSRNTPILLSLVRDGRIRCSSHIDERCGAFFALGAAKASGRPVALTCTSGTAAANYVPAVVEASHARVPLIVLTADRPPELRDVGAGQAIDQLKLYGEAVRFFAEVGVDVAAPEALRWMRQLACRAYWTALGDRPGPVHLNFPLREPLILDAPLPEDPVPGRPGGRPWVTRRAHLTAPPITSPPAPGAAAFGPVHAGGDNGAGPVPRRGLIVAGRHERHDRLGSAIAAAAQRTGYPVLADPLSVARTGPGAIATYDVLLREPGFAAVAAPELVIRVGDLPTSKPLRQWLAALDARQVTLDPEGAWQDPAAAVIEMWTEDPAAALDHLPAPDATDPTWHRLWSDADAAAGGALQAALGGELSEPAVARILGETLHPDGTLIVASSMPIRDVELYLPAGRPLPRVLSNRGANGIDGTVSTAFGVAAVTGRPVTLLIGDVALAHDIGGLAAAREAASDVTIVLINNDGGGIFHFLPVSGEGDAFDRYVATPHGINFSHAAGLYGLGHQRATTTGRLAELLAETGTGVRILEVVTDRSENLALHRRAADAALEAIASLRLSPTGPAASPGA